MTIRYVPILKSKAGEVRAVSQLKASTSSILRPIFEIQPVDWDYDIGAFKNTLFDHVKRIGGAIAKACKSGPSVYIDTILIDDDADAPTVDPLKVVLDACRIANVLAIPVTGPSRPSWQVKSAAAAVALDKKGACIRLSGEDMIPNLGPNLAALLTSLKLSPKDCDLVLDVGAVPDTQLPAMQAAVEAWISAIPNLSDWRTFYVSGTGFPVNLTAIPGNTTALLPRAEWTLWQWLYQRRSTLARMPRFGDYGIAHPDLSEMDPRLMQPSVSLRYTTDGNWLIFKGRSTKQGFGQMQQHCHALVQRPEYSGRQFSAADEWIDDCAQGVGGPGNLTTYRQVGTNHHLELLASQLASFPVP